MTQHRPRPRREAPNPDEPVDPKGIVVRDPRVKWLILAVVLLALTIGIGGVAVVDQQITNTNQQNALRQLVVDLRDQQNINHQNRLNDQQRTDDEIDSLINCLIGSTTNQEFISCVDTFKRLHPPTPSAQPSVPPASGSPSSSGQPSSGPTVAPSPSRAPGAATTAAPTPKPSMAPTPVSTLSPATPSPVISLGHICILGLCLI